MIRNIYPYKKIIAHFVFLFFFLFLALRFSSGLLPYQFQQPVIFNLEQDFSNILFYISGLNFIFQNKTTSIIFTLLLTLFSLIVFLKPFNRILVFSFWLLILFYCIGVNINYGHSSHLLSGIILLPLCFMFKKAENFNLIWEGFRYYVCWMYASAFFLKFYNGSIFQYEFGSFAFKENVSWIIYSGKNTIYLPIYQFFINNEWILNLGTYIIFLGEGSFMFGFFTKRWDNLLFWLVIIIHTVLYFFADVFFVEQCLLSILFLNEKKWRELSSKLILIKF